MNTENNKWSVVLVLVVIALLVLGSLLISFNIYDVIYLCFLVYGILRLIYLRNKNKGLDHQ